MTTIDQVLADKLSAIMVEEWPIGNFILCAIAIFLSVILCGAIGIERELRGRTAGLRTHLLVGVGSCLIMIISIYGFPQLFGTRDVARLAAQVITGVGFLGAGAIIHRDSGTRGLTTAATIWIVMAIGLACGSFNFILAGSSTIIILVVLIFFRKFESHINRNSPLITVISKPSAPVVSKILELAKSHACSIHDLHVELNEAGDMEATFLVSSNTENWDSISFFASIEEIEGVVRVVNMNGHRA